MPAATLPDGTIHYRDLGDPTAPPVVFVHGVLVNGSLWDDVAHAVAAAGLRAIVPDWPLGSHPEAMAPSADMSPRGVARMIVAFLDHLELTDACLVANDTGGALTQLALTIDARRVGKVVFTNCDTFDRFPPPPFDRLFRAARLPGALRIGFLASRSGRLARIGYAPLVATPLESDTARAWTRPGATQPGVRADLRRFLAAIDPTELEAAATQLDRFPGRALMAWAHEDPYFRIEDARRLAACFRSATVVEIDASRTFVPHDQPAVLADHITAFARDHTPANVTATPVTPSGTVTGRPDAAGTRPAAHRGDDR